MMLFSSVRPSPAPPPHLHHHRLLKQLADGKGLFFVHRGLVRDADLLEMLLRIKPLAHLWRKYVD